jgi:hypothetical protein
VSEAIENNRVLWIDTEQGEHYANRTYSWIKEMANDENMKNLSYYDLKPESIDKRVKITEVLISSQMFDLVILDGVRDLLYDFNSPKEAQDISTQIIHWASIYNVHVVCILHVNKTSDDARGHLGTELVNKSEIVLEVTNNGPIIFVKPKFSRSNPVEQFALQRDQFGIPYLVSNLKAELELNKEKKSEPKKLKTPADYSLEEHIEVLKQVFKHKEELSSNEFKSNLVKAWKEDRMTDNRAKDFYSFYKKRALVVASPRQAGNRTKIKLAENYR